MSGASLYNYFRDYDAQTGRYVQPDPLGMVMAGKPTPITALNHLYGYSYQNALSWADPFGLAPAPICRGTDCPEPPFVPTPDGVRPDPQKPQIDPKDPRWNRPDFVDQMRKQRDQLYQLCADQQPTLQHCNLCCARTAQLLRDIYGASDCNVKCADKFVCRPVQPAFQQGML